MRRSLLICSDLDRTLLPNGRHPESPGVRGVFSRLVSRQEVDLAYVSGRDLRLILDAMQSYRLPDPRFIIGDVGTSIYERSSGDWLLSNSWRETILEDWGECRPQELIMALDPIVGLTLQEPARQGAAKISYYTAMDADRLELETLVTESLSRLGLRYRLVWSADEIQRRGLLDILPSTASKLQAIEFLIETEQYSRGRVVFAGDSGNDLEVLASDLPAILVANAEDGVRSSAVATAARQGNDDALYLASGGFLGTNGNYAAGILEGVAHFFPETVDWMQE